MAVILAADVVIRGEKGKFNLNAWLKSLPHETFELAAITVAELWHGVERADSAHKARRRQYLEPILAALPVAPYTEQTAYLHARLWAQLQTAGKTIGAHDMVVAATALERGSQVATFNQRHFQMVPGLKVIEPGSLE